MIVFIAVVCDIFHEVSASCSCTCIPHKRINGIIPDDYSKYQVPRTNGNPLRAGIQLTVLDLDNIQEETMEFSLHLILKEEWEDPMLNLTKFMGKDSQFIPDDIAEHFWKPDLMFYNSRKVELTAHPAPSTVMYVHPNGKLGRMSVYQLAVSCPMDLHRYPMDIQFCSVVIASMKYSLDDVNVSWGLNSEAYPKKGLVFTKNIRPVKHLVADKNISSSYIVWNNKRYVFLRATFKLVRQVSSHLLNVYIPSSLVVMLSFVSPWLDYKAVPGRVSLGLTSMLTISTQVVQTKTGLPPVNYMTALDIWLFTCICTVFLSLLEFALAYRLSFQKDTRTIALPNAGKCAWGGKAIQLLLKFKHEPSMIDRVCRYGFPLSFFAFVIIYWSVFLSR